MSYLPEILCGVEQLAPSWTKIRFAPLVRADETFAQVTIPTPNGVLCASWRRDADRVAYELELPDGITAEVLLPGREQSFWVEKSWNALLES